jgi:hypothetical protein
MEQFSSRTFTNRFIRMINAHQSLERLRHRHSEWWLLLAARPDIALALASEKKFWRDHGHQFGWHASESPFDRALAEASETDFESERWFYEDTPIFEDGLDRAKIGAWCWWVSMKHVLHQASLPSAIELEISEPV